MNRISIHCINIKTDYIKSKILCDFNVSHRGQELSYLGKFDAIKTKCIKNLIKLLTTETVGSNAWDAKDYHISGK